MHITLSKFILGPLLFAQGEFVRRTVLRLQEPEGPRQGTIVMHPSDAGSIKILVVGDSSAAGVGVDHQDKAFAKPLAEKIATRLRRAVGWQLLAKSGIRAAHAIELLRANHIDAADVLVTAVGVNDVTGQRVARRFVEDVQALWRYASKNAGVRFGVITGIPPLHILPAAPQPLRWYLGRCAARLDDALKRWVSTEPNLRYCSLQWAADPSAMAADGVHPGPTQYTRWTEMVTEMIAELTGAHGSA